MKLSNTTIISAFYPLETSKHKIGQYKAWIQNFCKIPSAMVLFTTETYSLELHQWRKEFLDQTRIIVRPFDSFAMTCPSMLDFWKNQYEKDKNKEQSPELYAMWSLKQEFVRIVVNLNPFQSQWFSWCDIGIQRYSSLQYYYMSFPSDIPRLCVKGRMTFLEVQKIPDSYVLDFMEGKPMKLPIPDITVGAGCIVADGPTWNQFGNAYKEMLKDFAIRGWFAGKDTSIYFAILMEKRLPPYRLFFAQPFGDSDIPGIEWMSFPVMLGGNMDAELDTRFEVESESH